MSVPTILQNIVARKHEEVAERLQRRSLAELEQLAAAASPTRGFAKAIQNAAAARRLSTRKQSDRFNIVIVEP